MSCHAKTEPLKEFGYRSRQELQCSLISASIAHDVTECAVHHDENYLGKFQQNKRMNLIFDLVIRRIFYPQSDFCLRGSLLEAASLR